MSCFWSVCICSRSALIWLCVSLVCANARAGMSAAATSAPAITFFEYIGGITNLIIRLPRTGHPRTFLNFSQVPTVESRKKPHILPFCMFRADFLADDAAFLVERIHMRLANADLHIRNSLFRNIFEMFDERAQGIAVRDDAHVESGEYIAEDHLFVVRHHAIMDIFERLALRDRLIPPAANAMEFLLPDFFFDLPFIFAGKDSVITLLQGIVRNVWDVRKPQTLNEDIERLRAALQGRGVCLVDVEMRERERGAMRFISAIRGERWVRVARPLPCRIPLRLRVPYENEFGHAKRCLCLPVVYRTLVEKLHYALGDGAWNTRADLFAAYFNDRHDVFEA